MTDIFTPLEIVTACFKPLKVEVKETDEEVYQEQCGKEIVIEDWIYLHPITQAVEHLTLSGTRVEMETRWNVSFGYIIHGTHYYPDGSGEPDDYDFKEVAMGKSLPEAIQEAMNLWTKNIVDGILESLSEHEMAIEEGHTTKEKVLA